MADLAAMEEGLSMYDPENKKRKSRKFRKSGTNEKRESKIVNYKPLPVK
jgi:hypothetical protein